MTANAQKLSDIQGDTSLYLPQPTTGRLSYIGFSLGVEMFTMMVAFGEYVCEENLQNAMLAHGKGIGIPQGRSKDGKMGSVPSKCPYKILAELQLSNDELRRCTSSQVMTMLIEYFLSNRLLLETALVRHLSKQIRHVTSNPHFLAVTKPLHPPEGWVAFSQATQIGKAKK